MKRTIQLVPLLLVFLASFSAGAVPGLINFQGRLLDSQKMPRTGAIPMVFKLCDSLGGACDGSCQPGNPCLWTEAKTVTASNGVFATQLGSVGELDQDIFTGADVYLELTIEGETLSPRERLVSTGYSIRSSIADSLTNYDGSDLLKISSVAVNSVYADAIRNLAVTEDKLAGGISPLKIYGTAATLADNTFVGDQTFQDGALLNLSGVDNSDAGEGLRLPQAGDVSAGSAEGQIAWQSSDDLLQIGTGAGMKTIGIPNSIQSFTASGTWTKPPGVSKVYVQLWGGGGGGGSGASNASDGGGGGGAYCAGLVVVTGDVSVSVGAGGTSNGGNGGASTFLTLTAGGGAGTTNNNGGVGGTASGGDINLPGQRGGKGIAATADSAGSGDGGSSPFGGAGGKGVPGSNATGTNLAGDAGQIPGGGGAGGKETGVGGAGAAGLVIVMY